MDNEVKIRVGADLSSVDASLEAFTAQASKAASSVETDFQQTARAPKVLDENILSARESTRLLSEEFGMRLPRAVTSAIAEMVPAIGGLGGAMLGVFAVEQVAKWSKAAYDAMKELQGETVEEKKYWDEIIKDQERILTHPASIADAQERIAETNRQLADVDAKRAETQKELNEVTSLTNALDGTRLSDSISLSRALNDLKDKEDALNIRLNEQVTVLGKLEESAKKAAAAYAAGTAKDAAEYSKHVQQLMAEAYDAEKKLQTKATTDHLSQVKIEEDQLIRAWEKRNADAKRLAEEQTRDEKKAHSEATEDLKQQLEEQKKAIKDRDAAYKDSIQTLLLVAEAEEMERAAAQASVQGHVAAIASKLGLEKEYVIAEAAFNIPKELAMAFADLAIDDDWGAAQHFAAAAEWGVAAGQAVASLGGGGGGSRATAGAGASRVSGGGARGSSAGGGLQPPGLGGPASERAGNTFSVHVYGSLIHQDDLANFLAQTLQGSTQRGSAVITPMTATVPRS